MEETESTTITVLDWTSSALVDMSAINTSPGLSSLTSGRFRRDSQLMALLTSTSVIGFILNIAALAVLLQERNRHTATNLYLVNLAIGESSSLHVTYSVGVGASSSVLVT